MTEIDERPGWIYPTQGALLRFGLCVHLPRRDSMHRLPLVVGIWRKPRKPGARTGRCSA
jgi:hypothetical protein